MTLELTAQRSGAPVAEQGEGPIWTVEGGALRWVDMLRGDVVSWNPETGASTREHLGNLRAALRPRAQGRFYYGLMAYAAAGRGALYRLDSDKISNGLAYSPEFRLLGSSSRPFDVQRS